MYAQRLSSEIARGVSIRTALLRMEKTSFLRCLHTTKLRKVKSFGIGK